MTGGKLSKFLQRQHAGLLTTDWAVEEKEGKIFLDYNQNVRGKTLASIYSPGPVPEPPFQMPLRWDELDEGYPTEFLRSNTVPDRNGKKTETSGPESLKRKSYRKDIFRILKTA